MENLLARYPEEFFVGAGFRLTGQQARLGRCYADIIFNDKYNRSIIVEIKRGILGRDAVGQIIEYYGLIKKENPAQCVELIVCANVIPHERREFLEKVGIDCREISEAVLIEIAKKYDYQLSDTFEREKGSEEIVKVSGKRSRSSIKNQDVEELEVLGIIMKFREGILQGGPFSQGFLDHWEWEKNGGNYKDGRDFFSIHWEIQHKSPDIVRFHVTSPNYTADPSLNNIKLNLVKSILENKDIFFCFSSRGFFCEPGKMISKASIQDNKSTEAFKIKLKESQKANTARENIVVVHREVTKSLNPILDKFCSQLKICFSC